MPAYCRWCCFANLQEAGVRIFRLRLQKALCGGEYSPISRVELGFIGSDPLGCDHQLFRLDRGQAGARPPGVGVRPSRIPRRDRRWSRSGKTRRRFSARRARARVQPRPCASGSGHTAARGRLQPILSDRRKRGRRWSFRSGRRQPSGPALACSSRSITTACNPDTSRRRSCAQQASPRAYLMRRRSREKDRRSSNRHPGLEWPHGVLTPFQVTKLEVEYTPYKIQKLRISTWKTLRGARALCWGDRSTLPPDTLRVHGCCGIDRPLAYLRQPWRSDWACRFGGCLALSVVWIRSRPA